MSRFTRTRGRRVATATATIFLLAVASAAAYFLILASGEGSGSSKLGKGTATTYPIAVSFAEGLTPGAKEPVSIQLENTSGHATDIKKLTITPSTSVPACLPSWFVVSSGNKEWGEVLSGAKEAATPVSVPVGNMMFTASVADVSITFTETGANQSVCEGAEVTLHAVATP